MKKVGEALIEAGDIQERKALQGYCNEKFFQNVIAYYRKNNAKLAVSNFYGNAIMKNFFTECDDEIVLIKSKT